MNVSRTVLTADHFARLLNARRVGKGKWIARCVAHDDRTPSLSIWVGKKHPVMFRCMSQQCDPKSILDAMGLVWADVMSDRITDPKALKKAIALQKEEERKRLESRKKMRNAIDWARRCDLKVKECGKLLANSPESSTLARDFHWSLDQARNAQAAIRPFFHPCFIPGEYL